MKKTTLIITVIAVLLIVFFVFNNKDNDTRISLGEKIEVKNLINSGGILRTPDEAQVISPEGTKIAFVVTNMVGNRSGDGLTLSTLYFFNIEEDSINLIKESEAVPDIYWVPKKWNETGIEISQVNIETKEEVNSFVIAESGDFVSF